MITVEHYINFIQMHNPYSNEFGKMAVVVGVDPGLRNFAICVLEIGDHSQIKILHTQVHDVTLGNKGVSPEEALRQLTKIISLSNIAGLYIEHQYPSKGALTFLSRTLQCIEWLTIGYFTARYEPQDVASVNSKELKSVFNLPKCGNYQNKLQALHWVRKHCVPSCGKIDLTHHEADAILVALCGYYQHADFDVDSIKLIF